MAFSEDNIKLKYQLLQTLGVNLIVDSRAITSPHLLVSENYAKKSVVIYVFQDVKK